ncbi:MAG: glycosyltransferase, partial [Oscillospiraceae bacterium]|nr:glycosyltransferase [Oscillospiraceae bacterium]
MKVLFINTNIGYGGASKMMAFVANTLSNKGHDVTFLTYRNDAVLQTLLPEIKIQHEYWETDKKNNLLTIPKTVLKLHKYLKKNKYDVAVAFLSPSQLRLSLAGIGTKTKLLFSQRGDPYRSNGKGLINELTNYAFLRADAYA